IIALSIIPETDFSESLIASVIQVLSWMVMYALLVRIIEAGIDVYIYGNVTLREFVLLSVINITVGLATLCIPLISNLVFSGKNWGAIGMMGVAMLHHGLLGVAGSAIPKDKGFKNDSHYKDRPQSHKEPHKGGEKGGYGQVLERQGAIMAPKGEQNTSKTQGFDTKNHIFDHAMFKARA
ncbi:MAG: hypothetical protein HQM16_18515, partial [Deltaproteobacteria bacterium]|nr:hypothetical protein [Deltaproteobacteria bacterium]